jgi:hypothetical protein
LGLPGLIDLHVHFMPRNVMDKVWAYFDAVGPLTGRPWPIQYREDEDARLARLRALGVRAFPSLVYPHKPDMARWLNGWAAEEALSAGARIFKAHLQVGAYDPCDPLLTPVWAALEAAAVPVVVHCGNGPAPGAFTGPEVFAEVLVRHPRLVVIIAHMGLPDYAAFLRLAASHERVYLDTTMAFTAWAERSAPFPAELSGSLITLRDRIVLGSDFPNIPYPYVEQLRGLVALDLGDSWLRAVLHDNAADLLRLS